MDLSRHPTSFPTRYQQIAAQLEQELRTQYRCGDYLPSEQQLAERYQVNRHTLRRAVDQLVDRGWLQRRHGIGILVLMRPYDYPLHANTRFSQNLFEQGSHPTSERLLAVLRPCNGHVASALSREEGETVIHLRTLRRVNGVPMSLIDHYLPDLDWWPALQQFHSGSLQQFHSGSLHEFIELNIHQPLTRKQTRISARRAQAKESRLLEIATHAPLLCVRTLNVCTGSDSVAEYSVSLARADMIELTMEH
ncbi:phosphonate metabolism transcriptional regulator PhnF [Serratia proteamaculans]|uniref:Phosphonate metabolism transcriptional regulator PhnF n=1 Tax=Serratia proteamaculans TaxID=28151 RepID=A0A7U0NB65_SERPR|nr:phosphonate metabolism transcriptional regulator PhnF [Serratia proteamaculans]MBO1503136.1 phosphonate metabolism transcriptional regulator PhnF [Serratia proteamaculans]QQX55911.1 phosphonate metabolism transcriptional regulator PhnF [Serratia proteamaculans]